MHCCLFDFACIVTCTLCCFSRDPRIELDFFPVSLFHKKREIKNPNLNLHNKNVVKRLSFWRLMNVMCNFKQTLVPMLTLFAILILLEKSKSSWWHLQRGMVLKASVWTRLLNVQENSVPTAKLVTKRGLPCMLGWDTWTDRFACY